MEQKRLLLMNYSWWKNQVDVHFESEASDLNWGLISVRLETITALYALLSSRHLAVF